MRRHLRKYPIEYMGEITYRKDCIGRVSDATVVFLYDGIDGIEMSLSPFMGGDEKYDRKLMGCFIVRHPRGLELQYLPDGELVDIETTITKELMEKDILVESRYMDERECLHFRKLFEKEDRRDYMVVIEGHSMYLLD